MVAPAPVTDHRTAGGAPESTEIFALNRTTSPVRASVVRGSTAMAVTLLRTICTDVVTRGRSRTDARMVAFPGATPVTNPLASTVATAGDSEVQVSVAPSSGVPSRAVTVAPSVTPPPTTIGVETSPTAIASGGDRLHGDDREPWFAIDDCAHADLAGVIEGDGSGLVGDGRIERGGDPGGRLCVEPRARRVAGGGRKLERLSDFCLRTGRS